MNKIIRTICVFEKSLSEKTNARLEYLADKLEKNGFEVQTKRVCSPSVQHIVGADKVNDNYLFGVGALEKSTTKKELNNLLNSKNISFALDLSKNEVKRDDALVLFEIIKKNPDKTFNFAYVFNNPDSSPYFPSGSYSSNGFSIGLQPTDLAENCKTLNEWLIIMKKVWNEIYQLFKKEGDFLGIDSSIAPLFEGKSSFINFVKRLGYSFKNSTTSDIYIKTTNFIKTNNPKPIGLCGMMLPCLEDFELADEYEKGNFPVERNLFLSLQSGLGIDTYPIGIDQNIDRVLEILKLVQKLSNKHKKALSIRLVSDGKAKISEKTNFENQYLKDVIVREL